MFTKNRGLFFLLSLIFLSCRKPEATFVVTAHNFSPNVVLSVNDWETGEAIATENITPEFTFRIHNSEKRYARLFISGPRIHRHYLIYIEPGEQKIDLNATEDKYPVQAATEKGKELAAYYQAKERLSKTVGDSTRVAGLRLEQATPDNINALLAAAKLWDDRLANLKLDIIHDFAKAHPESTLTPILLDELGSMALESRAYKKIMDLTSASVKESKEGVALLKELNSTLSVSVGAVMPDIAGQMPQGENFDTRVLKKINVVICWMSYNNVIRRKHAMMVRLYKKYRDQGVEFIGVSLDKKRKYWTDIIKADGLIWPQYSDLMGAKSPNAKLSNMSIPYIFIIGRDKKILSDDVQPEDLDFEIETWLSRMQGR